MSTFTVCVCSEEGLLHACLSVRVYFIFTLLFCQYNLHILGV